MFNMYPYTTDQGFTDRQMVFVHDDSRARLDEWRMHVDLASPVQSCEEVLDSNHSRDMLECQNTHILILRTSW
jgi:hypothetical protein